MIQRATSNPDGTFDLHVSCEFCGKPIVTSGPSGMTCEDRCTDKWVRWDRLNRMNRGYLSKLGKLEETLAEQESLRALLFREDGTPKFSGR